MNSAWRGTGIAVMAMACLGSVGTAQDLEQRIAQVRDGTVRVTYPTREGVCGWGQNVRFSATSQSDAHWEADCETGPAHVVITRDRGRTVDIDTYVGGRWRQRVDVTDLGSVTGTAAADAFFALAETLDSDVADDAMYAAIVADAEVWTRVVGLARETERPESLRKKAVFWVGQLGDEEAVDVLVPLLQDSNREIQEQAVFSLAQVDDERAAAALRDIITSTGYPIGTRKKAIFWLGQSRSEPASAFLKSSFASLQSRELREQIIFAMSQHRSEENVGWLVNSVVLEEDLDNELREKGVFWLGQMRGQEDQLIDLYDRVDSNTLREKLIFAYSQRRDDASVDKLIAIANGDDHPDLRRKAIFWLGQSRHPKAIEALAELIGS